MKLLVPDFALFGHFPGVVQNQVTLCGCNFQELFILLQKRFLMERFPMGMRRLADALKAGASSRTPKGYARFS